AGVVYSLAYDVKSRCATPIDHLTDQRRLIAVSQRINDTRLSRAPRKKRSRDRVGLHVDHHDVLAVCTARERVTNARFRAARRVDDDLDPWRRDKSRGVFGDERRAVA